MRTLKKVLTLTAMAAALQACGGSDIGEKLTPEPVDNSTKAVFNPSAGASGLPFPIDLLFSGTADGSINIPDQPNSAPVGADASKFNPLFIAANSMDGFSTTAPMVVRFSNDIASPADYTSDGVPDGIRVFKTDIGDPSLTAPISSMTELNYGVDFVAGTDGGTLLIIPTRPLDPSTTYIVSVDSNLKDIGGDAVVADSTFSILSGAFQLAAGGLTPADFVLENDVDGGSCNFSDLASVGKCLDVNVEAYKAATASPNPIVAATAAKLSVVLSSLEATAQVSGNYKSVWQIEQLRRLVAKEMTALATAGVDITKVALTYSLTTEDVGTALVQAKAQVDGATPYDFPPVTSASAPTISVLNPLTSWNPADALPYEVISPGTDGDATTSNDLYFSNIYLGTLNNILEFVDPDDQNASTWQAVANSANWGGGQCAGLAAAATGSSNLVACNGFKPSPVSEAHSVPVMISAPLAEALAGGDPGQGIPDCSGGNLPVVIYQHGITSTRATLLAIADTLGSQCMVGVAIDMPKHGILPTNDPFGGSQLAQLQQAFQQPPFAAAANPTPVMERLVQVSSPMTLCVAQTGVATLPDNGNFYCPSGDNYVNLTNLANARDTLRQSVIDLHSLFRAVTTNTVTADSGSDIDSASDTGLDASTIGTTIDTGNVHFVGVSLGSIVGATFTANEPALQTSLLNVGGGGIAKILDGSPSFEPSITAGLFAAAGISKPSSDYEAFIIVAQTLVDSVDPMNFTADIVSTGTPILMQEVIGNPANSAACIASSTGCPDQVVPNNTFGTAFGGAWGAVSGTGQTGFMANQNPATVPVALAGTDSFAQGTGFISIAAAAQAGAPINPFALGPLGADAVVTPAVSFKGLGLPTVGPCGASGTSGIVRYVSGAHSSMLSPAADAGVTTLMQTQMVTFIASAGGLIAADAGSTLVFDASGSASQAADCSP